MPTSLFITGASGYVGRRLLSLIDPATYRTIYCLTRSGLPSRQPEPEAKMHWVTGDLLDSAAYAGPLACCDAVVHLAALTGKHKAAAYFRVNTEGTRVLVDACRKAGVRNFLHVSTIAVKFRDQSRYYYAQSKKLGEEIVAQSDLRFTILRPTIVVGNRAPVLESLCRLARAPWIPLFGGGQVEVQPIYVDDLIHSILSILDEEMFENQTLDLGGPEVLSMEDMLIRLRRALGRKEARLVRIPVGLIRPFLALFEKLFLPIMPLTAGQLASFANDGTIESNPFFERLRPRMKSFDEALRLATTHE
ncbi:MAG: NAD-dependent epimerase/dehydratase family protein [Acidobacteria bacterium]|nr:NAD-dependent epimerase/dehydratase family protein [Acidobacteriota bacterium]